MLRRLSSTTELRGTIEHFDERIDAYVGKLDGVLLHRLVGSTPSDKITVDGKELSAHYLLHFNPATFELSFLGDSVRLVDLAEELKRISDIAAAYLATLSDNSSSAPPAA